MLPVDIAGTFPGSCMAAMVHRERLMECHGRRLYLKHEDESKLSGRKRHESRFFKTVSSHAGNSVMHRPGIFLQYFCRCSWRNYTTDLRITYGCDSRSHGSSLSPDGGGGDRSLPSFSEMGDGPQATQLGACSAPQFFKTHQHGRIALPPLEVEVPPLVRERKKSVTCHHSLEKVSIPTLLRSSPGIGNGCTW